MKEFALKVAQSGFAAGKAFLVEKAAKTRASAVKDRKSEIARFDDAVSSLDRELSSAAGMADKQSAKIFEAERVLLKDWQFIDAIQDLIKTKGMDAASAIDETGRNLAEAIRNSGNEYIGERGDEVLGLTERLIGLLSGKQDRVLDAPSIIVAHELSPVQLSSMDPKLILGIVTVNGAPTSHVSIIAGNMGIPYVYGSEEAVASIRVGMSLIVDGEKLIVEPDEQAYEAAVQSMEEAKTAKEAKQHDTETVQNVVCRTKVYANIAGLQDIEALVASGAEGVGLFRTEFLFLGHSAEPSEEEQFQAYRSVVEAMEGKETVFRTIDVGSDKRVDWLDLPEERNPALGCRGLRVFLRDEELFETQLRALLRAAACGNVKIMIPMVTSVWEVDAVRTKMDACAKDLAAEGVPFAVPPLGIMVETPAAAMIADKLADVVDFFSIGTNDLTQYTLALDREAQGLDRYYNPFHEAVFRMIEMTAAAGHEHGIPTAVCGELASNPKAIEMLIEREVDELSVSIPKVDATKARVIEVEGQLSRDEETPSETVSLVAPADGKLIPMERIPDPAFSSGVLGECVGILPDNGNVYAPCDGIVSGIADTKHAITFTATGDRKILVHAGIDTVTLGGKGFTALVKEGDTVAQGDLVLKMDLDVIREADLSPMVITSCGF